MSAVSDLQTRHLYAATDSLLRFAMRADATLTGLCGLAVAFVADPLSSLTGLSSNLEYALGAFFVFYGLVVFSLAASPDLRSVGLGSSWPTSCSRWAPSWPWSSAHDRERGGRDAGHWRLHRGVRVAAIPGSAPPRDELLADAGRLRVRPARPATACAAAAG